MKDNKRYIGIPSTEYECILIHDKKTNQCLSTNQILTILNQQDYTINELLYKLQDYGKNTHKCQDCECYIQEIKYCWMYDMEVYSYDIVTECEHYQKKKEKKEEIN